jgi:hypothetical protein
MIGTVSCLIIGAGTIVLGLIESSLDIKVRTVV